MWGLEDLPFPAKLLIAVIFDVLDALFVGGDVAEMPIEGALAYMLTDNVAALGIGAADGILPAPIDFIPATTALVVADHLGWL